MEQSKSFGELVKTRRQEMSLSLKEVENATSIRMNLLRAIEEGEVEKLISPVYAQGFVKQYAIFLGLDSDALMEQFPHAFDSSQAQEFLYGIGSLEVRGNPGANVKWVPNAAWIAATAFIFLGAWALARYLEVI